MPEKRPVFNKGLGKFFVALREAKGWKQAQAADIATRQKIDLSYQTIRGLEEGKTKNANPDALRAVAKLYGHPYELIAAEVFKARFGVRVSGRDLVWQAVDRTSDVTSEGEAHDPASARIFELEQIIRDQRAALAQVSDVASRLVQIAKVGQQGDRVAEEGSSGRGRDRKAR